MTNELNVYETLAKLEIPYIKYTHPAVFTVEEALQYWKDESGMHCKNLFFRNNKGNKHYLVVLQYSKNLNIREFSLKIENRVMSFASEERLMKYLGLTPGSVSPFGLLNDANKEVEVIIDNDLRTVDKISFHPNINTASVTISFSDFIKFLNWCGNKYSFMEV